MRLLEGKAVWGGKCKGCGKRIEKGNKVFSKISGTFFAKTDGPYCSKKCAGVDNVKSESAMSIFLKRATFRP